METLVKRSIAGDKEALNELVTIVQKDIYHLALRMQGNMDDAMDRYPRNTDKDRYTSCNLQVQLFFYNMVLSCGC